MSNYLNAKTEFDIGDVIPLFETNLGNWYNWTIRDKKRHTMSNQYVYFMTRPGYEGWFTQTFIRKHVLNNRNLRNF